MSSFRSVVLKESMGFESLFSGVPRISYECNEVVFPTTNETGKEETISFLEKEPLHGDTVIGVSCFFLLNIVAARKEESSKRIENIIAIDHSSRVKIFWQDVKRILATYSDRLSVIEQVKKIWGVHADEYWGEFRNGGECDPIHHYRGKIDQEIESGVSWLASDEKFDRVKRIFAAGRFVFLNADLLDPDSIKACVNALTTNALKIDALYVSNIKECVDIESPEKREFFFAMVRGLTQVGTQVIQASSDGCPAVRCNRVQKVNLYDGRSFEAFFPYFPSRDCEHSRKIEELHLLLHGLHPLKRERIESLIKKAGPLSKFGLYEELARRQFDSLR